MDAVRLIIMMMFPPCPSLHLFRVLLVINEEEIPHYWEVAYVLCSPGDVPEDYFAKQPDSDEQVIFQDVSDRPSISRPFLLHSDELTC